MSETLDERLQKVSKTRIAKEGQIDVDREFDKVAESIGLSREDAGGKITFHGADPIVNSVIPLGTGASISFMLKALAATKVWNLRGGKGQEMSIELSQSISRLSALYKMQEMINGYNPDVYDQQLGGLMLLFRTKDGRFVSGAYDDHKHGR